MKSQQHDDRTSIPNQVCLPADTSQSIEWYADGQERIVEADGIQVVVRLVGRKGRRARIAITAPPGAAFLACDRNKADRAQDTSPRP